MRDPKTLTLASGDALILVDVQNDFLPGGALAVPDGDQVVSVLNRYIDRFRQEQLPVFASRDWHPPDHCSFQAQGGPWPPHCVQHSRGAALAADLSLTDGDAVISKGTRAAHDAYSAFAGTDLEERLRNRAVRRLLVGGLATDYCVLNTVLDGLKAGFEVLVLTDGIRPVDVTPGDGERALGRMRKAGATEIAFEALAHG